MPGGIKRSYTYASINLQLLSADLFNYYDFLLPPGIKGSRRKQIVKGECYSEK